VKKRIAFAALVAVIVLVVVMIRQSQEGNLVIRPDPSDPHPVTVHLPRVNQALAAAKSLAEENANAAIDAPRRPIRQPINLQDGRRLYGNVKAQTDGLIGYLRSGLSTRFAGVDVQAIDRELQVTQQTLSEFLSWSRRSVHGREGPIMAGAAEDPLKIGVDGVTRWLEALQAADERAIEQLRQQLLEYRLASWEQLSR